LSQQQKENIDSTKERISGTWQLSWFYITSPQTLEHDNYHAFTLPRVVLMTRRKDAI